MDDLAKDHQRATRLAQGLAALPGVEITSQATNMVFVSIPRQTRSASFNLA